MNISLERFEEWLKNKNLKKRTIENYLYYFSKFTYDTFSQETVSRFLSYSAHRNIVSRSFLINFQRFLKMNYKEFHLSEAQRNDIIEIELPKMTGRLKRVLVRPIAHEHIVLLEKNLDTEKLKLQLLMSYYCGLRLGELMKLRKSSFQWDTWKDQKKMGECRVYGKGDKEGIAIVPSFLMKRIGRFIHKTQLPKQDLKLFANPKDSDDKIKDSGRIWQMRLRQAGIRSGLTPLNEHGVPTIGTVVHPHRLRHSYGHYLLNVKKLNLREVQELLRHSSIKSTELYTYIDVSELKKKLELDDVISGKDKEEIAVPVKEEAIEEELFEQQPLEEKIPEIDPAIRKEIEKEEAWEDKAYGS